MARQDALWALGAMSGTSLDGVDAAMIRTDGIDILEFGPSAYRPYDPAERAILRAALGLWPGPDVAAAAELVETAHAEVLSRFPDAELVGFHGQTLAHDPEGRGTHQAGDGRILAEVLGKTVVWDFRSSDVALGGEGAPLAPAYHLACARWMGAEGPVAFLNLGGVGNLTWIDPSSEALLAFDTGPANAPIDDLLRARTGARFDRDGALAASGRAAGDILEKMLADPYFLKIPPKSLDRAAFAPVLAAVASLSDGDAAATLTEAVAVSVEAGLLHCPEPPSRVLVGGGGRRNAHLMARLAARLAMPVDPVEAVGLDGDMLEAQAFAFLAVRVRKGLPTSFPGTTGVRAPVSGGQISAPGVF